MPLHPRRAPLVGRARELLFRHPGVAEVAVVGTPDARLGEQIVAFIRTTARQSPREEEELFAYRRENLSPQKTPQRWVFVDAFPMTPSGKIQKFVLRERLLAEAKGLYR